MCRPYSTHVFFFKVKCISENVDDKFSSEQQRCNICSACRFADGAGLCADVSHLDCIHEAQERLLHPCWHAHGPGVYRRVPIPQSNPCFETPESGNLSKHSLAFFCAAHVPIHINTAYSGQRGVKRCCYLSDFVCLSEVGGAA